MLKIEQVFIPVTAQKGRRVPSAQSPGILPIDLEEILASADMLRIPQSGCFDLLNLFFHHLPSGAYAIGRLVPARGKIGVKKQPLNRYWLQCMVVSPETFLRFGNNPVFLYQEILSQGLLPVSVGPRNSAAPICLDRSRRWFDIPLLREMAFYPGAEAMAKLADTVLHSLRTTVSGGPQSLHVLSALCSLFPIRFRPELTFASGLFFDSNRYFRITGLTGKTSCSAETETTFSPFPYINLDQLLTGGELPPPEHGWHRFILEVLQAGKFDFFQTRLISHDHNYDQVIRNGVPEVPSADELDALGEHWLESMNRADAGASRPFPADSVHGPAEKPTEDSSEKTSSETNQDEEKLFRLWKSEMPIQPPPRISEKLRRWLLSDDPQEGAYFFQDKLPKRCFRSPLVLRSSQAPLFSPFQHLLAEYPNEEEQLRTLDRLVAAVLNGGDVAFDRLTRFWHAFLEKIDEDQKWRICEEYAHFVQLFITGGEELSDSDLPDRNLAALDLLSLFFNGRMTAEFSFDSD